MAILAIQILKIRYKAALFCDGDVVDFEKLLHRVFEVKDVFLGAGMAAPLVIPLHSSKDTIFAWLTDKVIQTLLRMRLFTHTSSYTKKSIRIQSHYKSFLV